VGGLADWLRHLARGDDDRAVEPDRERKSIGSEETYARDLTDLAKIREEVARLAEASARALEKKELTARTVVLKLRYSTFQTVTRSETRRPSTRSPGEIRERALALVDKTEAASRPVRLLGVSLHNLETGAAPAAAVEQPSLELAPDPQPPDRAR